jgi:hypothetical protein
MKKLAEKIRKPLFFTILAAALAMMAVPAMAQSDSGNAGQGATQQSMEGQQRHFDELTLKKFATANVELGMIQNEFAQKLQGIQDQEKAMALQKEMGGKMVMAVQNKGLEVETFNAIANQMGVDEQLRSRVETMIRQERGN